MKSLDKTETPKFALFICLVFPRASFIDFITFFQGSFGNDCLLGHMFNTDSVWCPARERRAMGI